MVASTIACEKTVQTQAVTAVTGTTVMVVKFNHSVTEQPLPEILQGFPATACGRFFSSTHQSTNAFFQIADYADNAGKLLLLIIPETETFSGTREHLVIWIDNNGFPVRTAPEIDSALLENSLWGTPSIRQETILQLSMFFKPDLILQYVPEDMSVEIITSYWSEYAIENNFTVALYSPPDSVNHSRGWGAFTGKGIINGHLEGMDMNGFISSILKLSNLKWNTPEHGYPAMQAFYARESE